MADLCPKEIFKQSNINRMKRKQPYNTPASELVEVEMNGILCESSMGRDGSGDSKLEDRQYGGSWGGDDDWI